jgi:hypothetical protein
LGLHGIGLQLVDQVLLLLLLDVNQQHFHTVHAGLELLENQVLKLSYEGLSKACAAR